MLKEIDYQPIAVLFGYQSKTDQLTFLGREGKVEVSGHSREIMEILKQCNGYQTISEIQKKIPAINKKLLIELLKALKSCGVIIDSRRLHLNFHKDSANPPYFPADISPTGVAALENEKQSIPEGETMLIEPARSPLAELLEKRRTIRQYSGQMIPPPVLVGLLALMYSGKNGRVVPSAGALYDLDIFCCLPRDSEYLNAGYYWFNPSTNQLVRLNLKINVEYLYLVFDSEYLVDRSGGIFFIAARFNRPITKYSNRGYRYMLIESGHIAQNAYLYGCENNLGILEYGGFRDALAAQVLGLSYPNEAVLLTLFAGYEDKKSTLAVDLSGLAWDLQQSLVGEGKPISRIHTGFEKDGSYMMPLITAVAHYKSASAFVPKSALRRNIAFATASTVAEVTVKAIAEGYERYMSGQLRVNFVGSAQDVTGSWIDSRKLFPWTKEQYKLLRLFQPFTETLVLQWVKGQRYCSGEPILVPVDYVFYPLHRKQLNRKLLYSANSSGVAAHTTLEAAIENGFLELIERDAIMVTWYARQKPTAFPESMEPILIAERINYWRMSGWSVQFLNITSDSIPVALCTIHSQKQWPHFVNGAAASRTYESAMIKAFNEAEYMLISWKRQPRKIIAPKKVNNTLDHAVLYFTHRYWQRLKWLLDAETAEPKVPRPYDLAHDFDPVVIDLNPDDKTGLLKVVRVISERLLPISFGYGTEHTGHPRFDMLNLKWRRKFPSFPHFFA